MDIKTMFVARCIVAAVAFICAAVVMCADKDGWGFLLIIGFLAIPFYYSTDCDDD